MKRDVVDSPRCLNKSALRINDSLNKVFSDLKEEFKEITSMFNIEDRVSFDKEFIDSHLWPRYKGRTIIPKINIADMGDCYEVVMLVAGFNKDDIDISLKENMFSVQFRKDKEKTEETEDKKYLVREISSRPFSRGYWFPEPVTEEGVECEYKDGVITCVIKKAKTKEESYKIKIK